MKGSEIFLGDLIIVVDRLAARGDSALIAKIGSALGLAAPPVTSTGLPTPSPPQPPIIEEEEEEEEEEAEPQPISGPTRTPTALQPTRTEPISGAPPWLDQVASFPVETDADLEFDPPYEPLFALHQSRGIISAALATRWLEGEIDEEQLVADRARRRPIEVIPRRPVPSLRSGVLVLLDRRDAMMPFFADQNHLVDNISLIIGRDRVAIQQFLHHPLKVLATDRRGSVDFHPPPSGTTILLVTDLGIGVPPLASDALGDEDWLMMADLAKRAGCPLVALVPYPPDRWPREVIHRFVVLPWDRSTNAGRVRSRIGPGLLKPS